jgi:DNA-binding response OmpR family regulator
MKPASILVVDDDSNIRASVRMCLETAGYTVHQAANGADALEQIHRESPDVVVLDLAMPVMDGMTVLAELRSPWQRSSTRVVVVTAHGSVKTAIDAMRLGASDFLEKPFLPEDLRMSVASVLQDHPAHLATAAEGYDEVLQQVRDALRAREFAIAERELMKAGTITGEDAAFLNLAGIMHESHGRIDCAKKFYERSLARDGKYRAAKENLKRLADLETRKITRRRVAFGDDDVSEPN